MMDYFLLLQFIFYMNPNIGLNYSMTTKNCNIFKSGSSVCNRVCNHGIPTSDEITIIKNYFGNTHFEWAVKATDSESISMLEKNNLHHLHSLRAAILNLNNLHATSYPNKVIIKKINLNSSDLKIASKIMTESYKVDENELFKVINLFKNKIPKYFNIYLGFYDNEPATAAIVIQHQDTVALNWVGTLPKFKKRISI